MSELDRAALDRAFAIRRVEALEDLVVDLMSWGIRRDQEFGEQIASKLNGWLKSSKDERTNQFTADTEARVRIARHFMGRLKIRGHPTKIHPSQVPSELFHIEEGSNRSEEQHGRKGADMDRHRLASTERELDALGWRIAILEHAMREVMVHLCARDDLMAQRFRANIEEMLSFVDRSMARHHDPAHEAAWPEERELISDLAESLLPAKLRREARPSGT